jgi:hypothetical protein
MEDSIKVIKTNEDSPVTTVEQVKDTQVKDTQVNDTEVKDTEVKDTEVKDTVTSIKTNDRCCLKLFDILGDSLKLDCATLYIVYQNLDLDCQNEYYKTSLDTVKSRLIEVDWLTYKWHKIPEPVFRYIFGKLSRERLVFFCGYFKTYFESVSENYIDVMIDSLVDKLNKK